MKRRAFVQRTALLTAGAALDPWSEGLAALPRSVTGSKKKVLLRSSWQTINIGDIAHTPGVLALCEKHLPDVEVMLWAGNVGNGVREMLQKRFPALQIVLSSEPQALQSAFESCDFLLHGSGPFLVATKDVERWVRETGKPFGVYGITLPEKFATDQVVSLLNQARFVFFRDSVSLSLARHKGVKAPIMEFGPDGAFGVDLRDDAAAEQFLQANGLEVGSFLCVIPRYRKTPEWKIPGKNKPVDAYWEQKNQAMQEHDHRPLREAIVAVVRETSMKVLICPEDVTQVELGRVALYEPLPADVKSRVVWRDRFWLTDEALSTYVRSAGLFGLEQHSPIMCIGHGIPALVGRFPTQTSKGFMWKDIGLSEWYFDVDTLFDMEQLTPTVLRLAKYPEEAKRKALEAQRIVARRQAQTMRVLARSLEA